ncbi:MAG: hypothetical protein LBD20_10000 [Spirochaetaceae bacterium]|nr:hypothetical protein [Spirochaetaceae bacterium]
MSACSEVNEAKKAADGGSFELEEFSIAPASMALFTDGGEKRFSAVLPEEAAGLVTVEWEIDNEDRAEIVADGETVTVYPKTAGNAVITAKIKPKYEGQALNTGLTEASCLLTVLTEFSLDNQHLLFFEDEPAQTVTALLPEAVLEVAKIVWTVETARKDSITVQGSGASAHVSASGLESLGIITARLEALDAAAFNGTGRSAVCVATSLETPFINVPASTFMLREGQAARTALITANYGPGRIDLYEPTVTWTSNDLSILRFEEGSWASLGRAAAELVAETAGQVEIAAELTVAGRTVKETAPVTVTAYVIPTSPATSLTLDKKPSSVIKTDTSELITAALTASAGAVPSDPAVEWSFSPNGYLQLIDDEDPQNKTKVRLRGAGAVTPAQQVTVTAKSRSNSAAQDSFVITVNPLVVTVTAAGSTSLAKGSAAVTLNAAVNVSAAGNRALQEWTSNRLDLVTITPSGTGSTSAQVAVKDTALVTSSTAIQITARASADNGVTSGSINITLNPHTFKIHYYKNDGSGVKVENTSYTYGNASQTLTAISALNWSRTDYIFKGWTLAAANESINKDYDDGAAITAFNDVAAAKTAGGTINLYAKWQRTASIQFVDDNPNDGAHNFYTGDAVLGCYDSANNNQYYYVKITIEAVNGAGKITSMRDGAGADLDSLVRQPDDVIRHLWIDTGSNSAHSYRGTFIYIGRTANANIIFNIDQNNTIKLRPAVDGIVPIGIIAELDCIDENQTTLQASYKQEADLYFPRGIENTVNPNAAGGFNRPEFMPICDPAESGLAAADAVMPFSGVFDGNNKTIHNLNIPNGPWYSGLFAYISGAVLKNINLNGGWIRGYEIGGIAGRNDGGTIINCSSSATMNAVSGGGIVGHIYDGAQIISCKYNGSFSRFHPGESYGRLYGGIVGQSGSKSPALRNVIKDCHNSGFIYANDQAYGAAGGILSSGWYADIIACKNSGTVYGESPSWSGGITAGGIHVNIIACYNEGITRSGGIIAKQHNSVTIKACYNIGKKHSSPQHPSALVGAYTGGAIVTSYYYYKPDEDYLYPAVDIIDAGITIEDVYYIAGKFGQFGENYTGTPHWPTSNLEGWGIGNDHAAGKYWKSLGGWNNGSPQFPKLWWEED